MHETWFEACEVLLSADPGRANVLPAAEVAAQLATLHARLAGVGASMEQLDGLSVIVERWRYGRPRPNQWYLDYRWLGAQEGTRRRVPVSA